MLMYFRGKLVFLVPFRAKREENFDDIYAPHVRKNENLKTIFSNFVEIRKISKPYSQRSEKYEKPQNPHARFETRIFKISKP